MAYYDLVMDRNEQEEINVKITVKQKKNDAGFLQANGTQYYHCKTPQDNYNSNKSTSNQQAHKFNLVHACNDTCQHSDDRDILVCSSDVSSLNFHIECSSLDALEVNTLGYNKNHHYVLHPTPSSH